MSRLETEMGGSRDAFPETAWSCLLLRPDADRALRRDRMEALIRHYWRPVYRFIRTGWARSVEDAKDLAQEFFCRLLEGDGIDGYRPGQVRFRCYLKGALTHFLTKMRREGQALKRGGPRPVVALDAEALEHEAFAAEREPSTPAQAFDRQWAQDLLEDGLARVEREMTAEGTALRYRVFEAYALRRGAQEKPTYEEIAARFGISASEVNHHLAEVRARLDAALQESAADSVTSREELIQEMTELFSA